MKIKKYLAQAMLPNIVLQSFFFISDSLSLA